MNKLALVVSSVVLLTSCQMVKGPSGDAYSKGPSATQNNAACQPIPAQGSPSRCVIGKTEATVWPIERYGDWTVVMANLKSPPGTRITRVQYLSELCTSAECQHTANCTFGCGPHQFPNDGVDYTNAVTGIVQWWGRTDDGHELNWFFDVYYQ